MSQIESIVEASISDLSAALNAEVLTSVELVSKYLLRIATYDTRNTSLNSVPLINEHVFAEAQASDDRRAKGQSLGILDGIPFTVKDSYKVKGMTVASGSVAFQKLVANEDAFTVQALRDAGAVLLGKTNMCPMAYGGMLRGVYGRAESPYNLDYLAAAFGSGSSNGSGVSVAASFAAFGMGEETVSSGRSPASNNGLVAYTPSRGIISVRGNWPLYPTCDVVVPHTRTVKDLCNILDVIAVEDKTTTGDFWRDQPFIDLSDRCKPWPVGFKPAKSRQYLKDKRIAVPRMYIEQCDDGPFISPDIRRLWLQAQADLITLGAQVVIIDEFPVMAAYDKAISGSLGKLHSEPQLPRNWNTTERGLLIAHAWEDFLQQNTDPACSSLRGIDATEIFPHLPKDDPQVKFTDAANAVHWDKLADYILDRKASSRDTKSALFDIPDLEVAVRALEAIRAQYFENWMTESGVDYVAFPAVGDVGRADSDINNASAKHAWTEGVKYSHGGRALRHLGIPSVTVCMGLLETSKMPMGLTILGRAYDDINIIGVASAYEHISSRRIPPPLTPAISTDRISNLQKKFEHRNRFENVKCSASLTTDKTEIQIHVCGNLIQASECEPKQHLDVALDIFISDVRVPQQAVQLDVCDGEKASFKYTGMTPCPQAQSHRDQVVGKIAGDSIMIMLLTRHQQDAPAGYINIIHTSDIVANE